ncbi:MAG TPA: alkaline phosphatase PhoX [Capillimicrobium sp.]
MATDTTTTRRHFIRGVAQAGASTVAAGTMLDVAGVTDLLGDSAVAAGPPMPFSDFAALGASSADAFEVPPGYRAQVVIGYGDEFANTDGTTLRFGYNNDFLAYFPLDGRSDEGLLFVNHEYPAPFFMHGNTSGATKTAAQIALEQEAVGNSVLHVKQAADGLWSVVSPSPYNRRITGRTPVCEFTGPLKGAPRIGTSANGSVANCSGGITPWGTALSCEENYQDYDTGYGWSNANGIAADPANAEYDDVAFSKYGWVVETDPYDPSWTPRKHTALGRFRHENTAFRAQAGKKFVLYMGDDVANGGIYKFVSTRSYVPGQRSNNLRILEEGTLYIAWFDESRRRFTTMGDTTPISPTSGTGHWREVAVTELEDTQARIRAAVGSAEFDAHFATNRPEDVEVDEDGTVLIALTNNSTVNDAHGAIRRIVEHGNDATSVGAGQPFTWADYAGGGDRGADKPAGERGFSSCDNLCFDSQGNLWVVTDISSTSLAGSASPRAYYAYHGNNAVFMIPRSGPNAGVAFRFANMPVESEGTGPYFTPDERTLFLNVQHPGEATPERGGVAGDPTTYTSWWPGGNKTAGFNPSTPTPSLVAVTKLPPVPPVVVVPSEPGGGQGAPPPPAPPAPGPVIPQPPASSVSGPDRAKPRPRELEVPARRAVGAAVRNGVPIELTLDEAARATLLLTGALPRRGGRAREEVVLARATVPLQAGRNRLRLALTPRGKLRLRRATGDVAALLEIRITDAAGNRVSVRRTLKLTG